MEIIIFTFEVRCNMNTIYDLANWFLDKSSMSHKKLQKLCYYAVAWHYTLYNSILINEDEFEAWVHGPVSSALWSKYKDYCWAPIPRSDEKPVFDNDTEDFLQIVYNTYGDYSGHQLEVFTHREQPWRDARKGLEEHEASNTPIDIEVMKKYYLSVYAESQND